MIDRLRCGVCHGLVKYRDYVFVDVLNTIIHAKCYGPGRREIIDKGPFNEIINKYNFFDDLKIKK